MINKYKALELLNYVNTPMSRENIALKYNANDIKFEKCELFNDFIQSLIMLTFDTYLGDEITNKEQQKNHFKWCWDKTVNGFKSEGITIGDNKSYEYFLNFMFDVYYGLSEKSESSTIHTNILRLWNYILDYNNVKPSADVDSLIDVYKLFDQSLRP